MTLSITITSCVVPNTAIKQKLQATGGEITTMALIILQSEIVIYQILNFKIVYLLFKHIQGFFKGSPHFKV